MLVISACAMHGEPGTTSSTANPGEGIADSGSPFPALSDVGVRTRGHSPQRLCAPAAYPFLPNRMPSLGWRPSAVFGSRTRCVHKPPTFPTASSKKEND